MVLHHNAFIITFQFCFKYIQCKPVVKTSPKINTTPGAWPFLLVNQNLKIPIIVSDL